MKPEYKPYRASLIIFLVAGTLIYFIQYFSLGRTFDAHAQALGTVLGVFMISFLVAWIVKAISVKKIRNSAIAFNVVLGLSVLSQFNKTQVRVQETQILNHYLSNVKQKYERMTTCETTEELIEAQAAHMKSLQNLLDDLFKVSKDRNKAIYKTIESDIFELEHRKKQWMYSYKRFMDERVMDYSLLDDTAEFSFQKREVLKFKDESMESGEFVLNLQSKWNDLFDSDVVDNEQVEGFLRAMYEKMDQVLPILGYYYQAHALAAFQAYQILELLESSSWYLSDNEFIIFEDDSAEVHYSNLYQQLTGYNYQIDSLNSAVSAEANRLDTK